MRFMRGILSVAVAAVVFGAGLAAAGDEAPKVIRLESVEYRDVPEDTFAAFVKNWDHENEPLCAVIRSKADWDKYFAPAVTMGNKKPTAPDEKFFEKGILVVVARVMPAPGEEDLPLSVRSFLSLPEGQELTYRYAPPAAKEGSQMSKSVMLLAVPKKYAGPFRFIEEREVAVVK